MKYKLIFVLVAILLVGFIMSPAVKAAAVENPKKPEVPQKVETSPAEVSGLPDKDSEEYWVIRSAAINELTAFLTKKRTEVKTKIQYFKDYMGTIGLDYTKDFFAADIQVPNDVRLRAQILGILDKIEAKNIKLPQKPFTWEELVSLAMKMEMEEGYTPMQIENEEELEQFKIILDRKEKFAIKVREEMEKYVQTAIKGWVYLGQMNKQEDFKVFALQVSEKKKQDQEAKRQALLEEKTEKDRQRREQEKQNIWQNRQDRLQERYGYYYY
jgi:hypothetical protein